MESHKVYYINKKEEVECKLAFGDGCLYIESGGYNILYFCDIKYDGSIVYKYKEYYGSGTYNYRYISCNLMCDGEVLRYGDIKRLEMRQHDGVFYDMKSRYLLNEEGTCLLEEFEGKTYLAFPTISFFEGTIDLRNINVCGHQNPVCRLPMDIKGKPEWWNAETRSVLCYPFVNNIESLMWLLDMKDYMEFGGVWNVFVMCPKFYKWDDCEKMVRIEWEAYERKLDEERMVRVLMMSENAGIDKNGKIKN